MLTKKKRISKKEMKEDKLVTSYYSAHNFFVENQAKILIGLGAVALVVVAVILFSNKKSNDDLTAAALLSKVIPVFEAGQYQEAVDGQPSSNIKGLKSIVEDYGSTENGEVAKIYLAHAYTFLNKWEEAYNYYSDYGGSNVILKSTALAGEAAYYETKENYKEAAGLYKKAAKNSDTNPSNAEYLLKAGINFIKTGNKEEAESLFNEIKEKYKTSPVVQELDRYLIQLKG